MRSYLAVAAFLVLGSTGAAAQEAPQKLYQERELDEAVERLDCPMPPYPDSLREAGSEGQVVVRFVVDTAGAVQPRSIEVLSFSHQSFVTPTTDMIAQCRFRPGRVRSRAVRVQLEMPVIFTLAGKKPT